MLGLGKGVVTLAGNASRDLAEIYQHHAAALYAQALMILGDEDLAEQVACDVIVDEGAKPPVPREGAAAKSRRLAVSVLRRCRELAAVPAERDRSPGPLPSRGGVRGDARRLGVMEREALALVLFGGLGYRQAGREIGITAPETAALLRAALVSLAR